MATKKSLNDSINVAIFSALKVSELSKVPTLIISNPGIGKSTTVELFSKIRGYELVLLRGNSTTNEEIMGYDTVPEGLKKGAKAGALHLRPSWFDKLMDYKEQGKKTLLFLDEITTANEFVQASLLHLIFERMCGDEKLPDDTLIVAAGNYAQNLSNTMSLLPPTMNRFSIFNIVPREQDLDTFLCKYDGATTSITGECMDFMQELTNILTQIDSQEINLEESRKNKIGGYIEKCILTTTKRLWKGGSLDMTVTELNDIYASTENDDELKGFITFRTLNYLRDVTLAYFQAFGKDGIQSRNYLNSIKGLVGLAISRDKSKSGDVKTTDVSKEYFNDMKQAIAEILKLENKKLPEYQEFFLKLIKNGNTVVMNFPMPVINALGNKLDELIGDKELEKIERPIESVVVNKILDCLVESSKVECGAKYKLSPGQSIDVESLTKWIVSWNSIAKSVTSIIKLTSNPTRGYKDDVSSKLTSSLSEFSKIHNRLSSFKLNCLNSSEDSEALANLIPKINQIK